MRPNILSRQELEGHPHDYAAKKPGTPELAFSLIRPALEQRRYRSVGADNLPDAMIRSRDNGRQRSYRIDPLVRRGPTTARSIPSFSGG